MTILWWLVGVGFSVLSGLQYHSTDYAMCVFCGLMTVGSFGQSAARLVVDNLRREAE